MYHPLEAVAAATHSFKSGKITNICSIWDLIFANVDVETLVSFSITAIWSANKMD